MSRPWLQEAIEVINTSMGVKDVACVGFLDFRKVRLERVTEYNEKKSKLQRLHLANDKMIPNQYHQDLYSPSSIRFKVLKNGQNGADVAFFCFVGYHGFSTQKPEVRHDWYRSSLSECLQVDRMGINLE